MQHTAFMGIDTETKENIKKNLSNWNRLPTDKSCNENLTKKSFRGTYIYAEIL